nr:G protein-coupled receptor [Proales similis]
MMDLKSGVMSKTEPVKLKLRNCQLALFAYLDELLSKMANVLVDAARSYKTPLCSASNIRRTLANGFACIQSMNECCCSYKETPELFCEPHIHTGFRPTNRPYSFYVKSLFMKHNETVNAWSHYLGAIYMISLLFTLDFSDPYSWPIMTSILTSIVMFCASASAHLMHQKSHQCHMTCFLCDFAGISFNGYGAALMQTYFCAQIWYYNALEPYILPLIGMGSALCCLFNSIAQTKYSRPYPAIKRFLQFAPCGLVWAFTMFPLVIPFIWPGSYGYAPMTIHYGYHATHVLLFLLGASFFALDFPQRFFPGKLDFIGQGHHLFHICIFLVVKFQLKACYLDYMANRELIAATRTPPSLFYCFGPVVTLLIFCLFMIYKFSSMISHNFDSHGNFLKRKLT